MSAGPSRTCVCSRSLSGAYTTGLLIGLVVGAAGAWILIWLTQYPPT